MKQSPTEVRIRSCPGKIKKKASEGTLATVLRRNPKEYWERLAVERAIDGDPEDLGELFQAYRPKIARHLSNFGVPHDEIDDVIGETWIRAQRGIRSFGWKSSFVTWVLKIATNYVTKTKGKNPTMITFADVEQIPWDASEHFSDEAIVARVELAKMEGKDRLIWGLHAQGCSNTSIAKQVGLSDKGVKLRLERILKHARSAGGQGEHEP